MAILLPRALENQMTAWLVVGLVCGVTLLIGFVAAIFLFLKRCNCTRAMANDWPLADGPGPTRYLNHLRGGLSDEQQEDQRKHLIQKSLADQAAGSSEACDRRRPAISSRPPSGDSQRQGSRISLDAHVLQDKSNRRKLEIGDEGGVLTGSLADQGQVGMDSGNSRSLRYHPLVAAELTGNPLQNPA